MKKKKDIDDQRKVVMDAYPGVRWHERVSRMEPAQFFAIFKSIEKKEKKRKKKNIEQYHQIDIFEYMANKGE